MLLAQPGAMLALALAFALAADPAAAAPLDLGPVTSRVTRGTTAYLALAGGGVAVVDESDAAAPKVVARLLEGKAVSRLFLDGDRLVALVLSEEAVAFSIAAPGAPVLALPSVSPLPAVPRAVPPPAKATGRVVEVKDGRVIFDGGTRAGFRQGMHVRVVSQQPVKKPDLEHGGTAEVPSGDVTAVVAVEDIGTTRAMAVLGRGDTASTGDVVEETGDELSERLFLPRRAPFHVRAGFHARPFLGLNTKDSFPIGVLVDGYATYTFSSVPLALTAEIAPAGFVVLSQDLHYPVTVVGGVSYVTDFFEVGLGAGALVGNEGPCTFLGLPSTTTPVCEVNTGFTFNQLLRLGPVDGIHLAWESSVFARPTGFVLGVGRGEIALPVSSRFGLYGAGGDGENGWAFGEIGVRSSFGGTGGPGTVILSTSLGVAGIFDGPGKAPLYQRESVVGPTVAFGAEWRL